MSPDPNSEDLLKKMAKAAAIAQSEEELSISAPAGISHW